MLSYANVFRQIESPHMLNSSTSCDSPWPMIMAWSFVVGTFMAPACVILDGAWFESARSMASIDTPAVIGRRYAHHTASAMSGKCNQAH